MSLDSFPGLPTPGEFLREKLLQRKTTNSAYSLRAFSRDLGCSSSFLSLVFAEKRKLSEEKSLLFASMLQLKSEERKLFLNLARLQRTEDLKEQNEIIASLKQLLILTDDRCYLKQDIFECMAEWYHLAIVELTRLKTFQND